jgi:FkbM family methyltransferase
MPSLDSVKERGRGFLVHSMRACVANDRLPWIAKYLYVTGSQLLLPTLGIESDETALESEYGTKFVAGPGSFWLNSFLRSRGVWEPVLSEFILRHVREGDVCVDVGANIGYFSLLFAQRVGPSGKVIAIEAAADTARRLRANLALNGATGIVDVVEAACAPQKGEITFYLHRYNDGWCRLSPPAKRGRFRRILGKTWIPVTVAADTLTSIVGADAERVSFIKVDIEGGETAITPQIAAGFSHPRLVVALEVIPPIEAALMPFKERGFYIYDLHNDYHWVVDRKVPAITGAAYGDFYHRAAADVLLSRQPLALS